MKNEKKNSKAFKGRAQSEKFFSSKAFHCCSNKYHLTTLRNSITKLGVILERQIESVHAINTEQTFGTIYVSDELTNYITTDKIKWERTKNYLSMFI